MVYPRLAGLYVLLGLAPAATAQTVLLTPSTTVLSSAGGSVTFTATLKYTTLPSTLGLTITLPPDWTYVSGTSVPGSTPAEPAIAPTAGRSGQLEWAFINPPASPVTFTFTTTYPGTATSLQALTPTTVARDGTGATPIVATAPTYTLSPPSNIVTWNGTTGNWTDAAQWTPNTAPINAGGARFSATVAAGVAALDNAVTIDNLTFAGGTIAGSGNLTLAGLGSTWIGGIFSGLGELIVAPGAQLTAPGTASHDFNQTKLTNQGQFLWTGSGNLGSGGGGSLTNAPNAVFTDAASSGTTAPVKMTAAGFTGSFTFSNAGLYQKTGLGETKIEIPFTNTATGTIAVKAGNLHFDTTFTMLGGVINLASGATTQLDAGLDLGAGTLIGGGTVQGNVTVGSGGFISPGDTIGTLTIAGNLTLLGSARLSFDIANATQGTGYDFLQVQGTATLGGDFSFHLAGNATGTLLPTDTLTLLSASSVIGTFVDLPNGTRLNAASGIGSFVLNYGETSITLSGFQAIPEPSTWLLLTGGLGALAAWRRRQRNKVVPPSMS